MDDFKQSVATVQRQRQLRRLVGIMVGIVLAFVIFVLGMVAGIHTERVRREGLSFVASRQKITKPIAKKPRVITKYKSPAVTGQTDLQQEAPKKPGEEKTAPVPSKNREEQKKDELKLTFYETLTQKTPDQKMEAVKETKVATAPPKSRPGPDEKKRYFVYVASFKNKAYAEALEERLAKKGYAVYIVPVELPTSGLWYRVKVGGYTTQQNAERAHEKLRITENIKDARVVRE